MIAAGVPLRTVARRGGHAQMSATSNIYAHAIQSVDEYAAGTIADILSPVSGLQLRDNSDLYTYNMRFTILLF